MSQFQYRDKILDLALAREEGQTLILGETAFQWQEAGPGCLLLREGPWVHRVHVHQQGEQLWLFYKGQSYLLTRLKTTQSVDIAQSITKKVAAPMTGKLLQVLVAVGQDVEIDQEVAILESMKMETVLTAPYGGTVQEILCQSGEQVQLGQELLRIEPAQP